MVLFKSMECLPAQTYFDRGGKNEHFPPFIPHLEESIIKKKANNSSGNEWDLPFAAAVKSGWRKDSVRLRFGSRD
ncbi:hypothetical protein CEXT_732511 [Caerostris extrusa]|uniref:Uncharacterized protein n=1 Tax=Caerostris extrusa TaxID=172846 RepID=A0AAV4R1F7_CAEEX|nr:hypothetical protein CEXT_732511 [Caerostris extrusa]